MGICWNWDYVSAKPGMWLKHFITLQLFLILSADDGDELSVSTWRSAHAHGKWTCCATNFNLYICTFCSCMESDQDWFHSSSVFKAAGTTDGHLKQSNLWTSCSVRLNKQLKENFTSIFITKNKMFLPLLLSVRHLKIKLCPVNSDCSWFVLRCINDPFRLFLLLWWLQREELFWREDLPSSGINSVCICRIWSDLQSSGSLF